MLVRDARRRSAFMNFDLTRFTPVGWLVFLFSFALTFAAAIYLANQFDIMFPLPPTSQSKTPTAVSNPGIWVGIGIGVGSFFAIMGVFRLVGVKLIRPKPAEPETKHASRGRANRSDHGTPPPAPSDPTDPIALRPADLEKE